MVETLGIMCLLGPDGVMVKEQGFSTLLRFDVLGRCSILTIPRHLSANTETEVSERCLIGMVFKVQMTPNLSFGGPGCLGYGQIPFVLGSKLPIFPYDRG